MGDDAPDFDLEGIDGATGEEGRWKLSDERGHPVVLAFYPSDNTPVCTAELEEYTREIGSFADLDARVFAISPQSPQSHREFAADRGGFAFPLLSDPDRSVGRDFEILGLLDLYRRSTFVVDRTGRIAWAHRYVGPGLSYRPVAELVGVLRATS